jgi:hypothetical protein
MPKIGLALLATDARQEISGAAAPRYQIINHCKEVRFCVVMNNHCCDFVGNIRVLQN